MWRKQDGHGTVIDVYPGVCLTIPLGTHFQFARLAPNRSAPSASRCLPGQATVRRSLSQANGNRL